MNLAPNGKPSNLTPEQYRLVRTPAFKKWFGDWENDIENSSKIVDENGEPLVVYHGSPNKFFVFKTQERPYFFSKNKENAENFVLSFKYSKDMEITTYNVFLNIRNLFNGKNLSKIEKEKIKIYVDSITNKQDLLFGVYWDDIKNDVEPNSDYDLVLDILNNRHLDSWHLIESYAFQKWLKSENYDGFLVSEIGFNNQNFGLYNSKNIKLADGTNTTFDSNNADIRFSRGGKLLADKLAFIKKNEIGYYWLYEINEKGNNYQEVDGDRRLYVVKDMAKRWGYRLVKPKEFNDYYNIPERIRIEYAKGGEVLLAPNGQPSNLTPEQYRLVRTPAFKKWFGDWENDASKASKVVDENGEPLVVYHGTGGLFNKFDEKEKGSRGRLNEKFWAFTSNLEIAKIYAESDRRYSSFSEPRIISVFLDIKEMPTYDNRGRFYRDLEVWGGYKNIDIFQLQDWHDRGFDMGVEFKKVNGFCIKNTIEMEKFNNIINSSNIEKMIGDTYYVRNSNQIKLADGSNTTFDANNPDIRYEQGGSTQTAFKKWFKNSKVVDKKGNPLVVYHGSPDLRGLKEDWVFKTFKSGEPSYFFTDDYKIAKSYADPRRAFDYQQAEEGVLSLYLSLQNPLTLDAENQIWRKFETKIGNNRLFGTREIIKYAQENGYDGVIVKNVRDYYNDNEKKSKGGNVYVAFKNTQIKLADGSNTTFDGSNPDIRFDDGGKIKFKTESEEERIEISIKDIGSVTLVETYPKYEFQEDLSEKEFDKLGLDEDDMIGKIEHIAVTDKEKGKGYAKLLMNKAIDVAIKKGLLPLYLNASPMGSKGLGIDDLTKFYESFGFKVFKKQVNNNLMLLNKKFDLGGTTMRKPKNILLAPNGKPSNLTPEQYRLVRTPAFKKWFGDWENSPETASKVVDENGEPLVVYHGSNDIITEFNSDYSYYGEFWFSRNKEKILKGESGASGIKYILPCFLNIKKMAGWNEYQNLYTDQRIQMGYDGTNIDEDYIAYEPNQIKLADGTNTTFDGSNPDIRFGDGGKVLEVEHYIKNIRSRYEDDLIVNIGDFGKNGVIAWKAISSNYIFLESLHRDKDALNVDFDVKLKQGSIGEGSRAIASLFEMYPQVEWIGFELGGSEEFYDRIGAVYSKDMSDILKLPRSKWDVTDWENRYDWINGKKEHYFSLGMIPRDSFFKYNSKKRFDIGGLSDGGLIETLTTEQVEQKLGRKLHWWNDDVVLIKGVRYKKVFLRPEYQVILS